jgi:hypothetical protein
MSDYFLGIQQCETRHLLDQRWYGLASVLFGTVVFLENNVICNEQKFVSLRRLWDAPFRTIRAIKGLWQNYRFHKRK